MVRPTSPTAPLPLPTFDRAHLARTARAGDCSPPSPPLLHPAAAVARWPTGDAHATNNFFFHGMLAAPARVPSSCFGRLQLRRRATPAGIPSFLGALVRRGRRRRCNGCGAAIRAAPWVGLGARAQMLTAVGQSTPTPAVRPRLAATSVARRCGPPARPWRSATAV